LAAPAAASEVTGPVERLYAALLGIMKQGRATPFARRYDAIAPVIDAVFDLPGILQVSVGLRWAALPADEQAALLDAYRAYTVSTYVANFDNFNGQRFEVLPGARAVGNDQVVQSRIIAANGSPRALDYALRPVGGQWRIVDVLFDGSISRLAVQRSDFRAVMAGGGGPALLASLQQKTADLQAASQ
jgi:phospholipid transport system substrate-binding protein